MLNSRLFQVTLMLIVAISFFVFAQNASAVTEDEITIKSYFIRLDEATVQRGYTVTAFDDAIKLSLVPGVLSEATGVDVLELHEPVIEPWQLDRISDVYQFEFRNAAAYDNHKPFIIQLKYQSDDDRLKQAYFFDKNFNSWRPLPTRDYFGEQFVRFYIHLPFARVAVFSNPEVMAVGRASWYGYKGGNFAASPDFPKGSRLRVTNLENNEFVDVEINDWGPDRSVHPDRVIDLDKVAFKRLGNLRDGIINVGVEPLFIPEERSRVLGIKIGSVADTLQVNAKAAIVADVKSGEVIFSKNSTTTLPLASLTKVITAYIFLNTNPDFDKVVTYKDEDEEKTWKYVDKYDSARLLLKDGDKLTIRDLFLSTLMASTNNTAETLVRISGLSREEFIDQMNRKVYEWGAKNTVLVEPTGLAPANVSTVSDYVIITKRAFKHPKLAEVTTSKEYKFETLKEKKKFRVRNANKLLSSNLYITGGKTGYLDEAGYCLMTKIKVGKRELIGVLFGAEDKEQSFDEMKDLLLYGIRK